MIPKAELHIHLEGSISPSMARKLAAKHQLMLPITLFNAQGEYQFDDFFGFLTAYDEVSQVVKSAEDYYIITLDYLIRSAKQGSIYVELTISPDHARENGIPYPELLAGVNQAIREAKQSHGIIARLLVVFVRQLGLQHAQNVLDSVLKHPDSNVVGVSLAGDEINYPASQFKAIYQQAAANGLGCSAHAGEFLGPDNIWDTVTQLPVTRLAHGVHAIDSPELIDYLLQRDICLELAPGSNLALGVYPDWATHPLPKLLETGLILTLNSDDPPFFNTDINNEYQMAQSLCNLSASEVARFTYNAIKASFLSSHEKQSLLISQGLL